MIDCMMALVWMVNEEHYKGIRAQASRDDS